MRSPCLLLPALLFGQMAPALAASPCDALVAKAPGRVFELAMGADAYALPGAGENGLTKLVYEESFKSIHYIRYRASTVDFCLPSKLTLVSHKLGRVTNIELHLDKGGVNTAEAVKMIQQLVTELDRTGMKFRFDRYGDGTKLAEELAPPKGEKGGLWPSQIRIWTFGATEFRLKAWTGKNSKEVDHNVWLIIENGEYSGRLYAEKDVFWELHHADGLAKAVSHLEPEGREALLKFIATRPPELYRVQDDKSVLPALQKK